MGNKIVLTNNDLHQIVKQIKEQVEGDYYKISPEEYLQLMSLGSYHGKAITKMKRFEGKPLWITGDLNLDSTPTDSLGNVAYIDGSLNISRTNVSNLGDMKVKGYLSDSGSPRERIREKQELNAKLGEQESLRDSDEWALEQGDETGEKAHALFDNLVNNGEIEQLSDEEKEKLTILRRKLQDLEQEYEGIDDNDERAYELQETIDETQTEIEELEENNADVYMMYASPRYTHYGLQQFEVLIPGFKDREYTVGTDEEMDAAALEYAKNYVDDVGDAVDVVLLFLGLFSSAMHRTFSGQRVCSCVCHGKRVPNCILLLLLRPPWGDVLARLARPSLFQFCADGGDDVGAKAVFSHQHRPLPRTQCEHQGRR